MISHIMLTFSCDRCGAEKQRPASEDDKTPPLPYGWVSFDSAEDSRKRHKCLECCACDGYAAAEDAEDKEPGQTYWEAEFKDTPWSNVHEQDRAEAREIEAVCRKGFVSKKTLVAIVMRWVEAARAGDEGAAEYCVGETFLRTAKLVLEEDELEELERLYTKLGG